MRPFHSPSPLSIVFLATLFIVPVSRSIYTHTHPESGSFDRTINQAAGKPDGATSKHVTRLQPESLSPYDLALFLGDNPEVDLRDLWKQLGIHKLNLGSEETRDELKDGYIDRFLSRCQGCDVETFAYELDGEPGREVLLRVSNPLAESCRYLLFKQIKHRTGKPEWKLLGHIDHDFGRYKMPEHYILYCNRKQWLAVKVQGGSGSGFSKYHDRLFEIYPTGLKERLSFPSEGSLASCCHYPTQEFKTRIVNCEFNKGLTRVELEFSVSYSGLFQKRQKAIFASDPKSPRLVLDAPNSALSEEEIEAIYDAEGLSDQDFIKYNFQDLSNIAAGKDNKRKEWLRLFLDQGIQSQEKESLRQLLKD